MGVSTSLRPFLIKVNCKLDAIMHVKVEQLNDVCIKVNC